MTMNDDTTVRKNGYSEDDLFSNGNGPAPHSAAPSPKPLFPAAENPAVRPLFESSRTASDPVSAAAPEQPSVVSAPPPQAPQEITEAFIERKLKEAGPTAFVSSVPQAGTQEEMLAKAEEASSSYLPRAEAPEIRDPIVVQGKAADEESEPEIELPASNPPQEAVMTALPPEDAKTSFAESPQKEHAPANEPPPAQETPEETNSKLKSARPLPAPGPRYGKIRTREAIIPPDIDRNKIAITADPATSTIGKLMQNARKQAGMSLEQASAATRIKKNYIAALEEDDFKSLPSGIFPSAYVRTLCGIYNLNEESRAIALRKIRESAGTHEDVPEQLIHHLEQDVQKNEEEEKRINKIFYLVTSAAALVLILIVAGIVLLTLSLRQPETEKTVSTPASAGNTAEVRTAPVRSFDARQLESLTPPQFPAIMRELVIPSR